jgi:hypothetical protein
MSDDLLGIPLDDDTALVEVRKRARYLATVRPEVYVYDNDKTLWIRGATTFDSVYACAQEWVQTGQVTRKTIVQRMRAAEEGDQVPFPDEETKNRAFGLREIFAPGKQIYLTTEEDYALWLKTPKAPTPGS